MPFPRLYAVYIIQDKRTLRAPPPPPGSGEAPPRKPPGSVAIIDIRTTKRAPAPPPVFRWKNPGGAPDPRSPFRYMTVRETARPFPRITVHLNLARTAPPRNRSVAAGPCRRVMVRGVPEKIWRVPFGERGVGVVYG